MRNLYTRLGVDSTASTKEIRAAISSCSNASVRKDASVILLTDSRRRIYDRMNLLLTDIGDMRAMLGLSHADNWDSELANEYDGRLASGISEYEQIMAEVKKTEKIFSGEYAGETSSNKSGFGARIVRILKTFSIGAIIWLIFLNISESNKPSSYERDVSRSAPVIKPKPEPVFNEPSVPTPRSGIVRRYTSLPGRASLKIQTSAGSNYLVKIASSSDQRKAIMDIFIRGGNLVEVDAPIGKYIIKYAYGPSDGSWYGYQYLFGPDTEYHEADRVFHIQKEYGYEITLYRVQGGNLRTKEISKDKF